MEWNSVMSLKHQVEREKDPEGFDKYPISELERDYQAIITSSAFRRLQDKTQVFPLDKSDFVRTRLTHSIEVSTVARQLGLMVTKGNNNYLNDALNNVDVVNDIPVVLSCAGLLHDIGNPPFGHFGEVVIGNWFENAFKDERFIFYDKKIGDLLNEQMKADLINYEGNAQALRILTKVRNNANGYEINLSYAVLNTLVKYPTDSLSFNRNDEDVKKHKLGYFTSEKNILEEICNETGTLFNGEYHRHPLVFLLEAADDIAYATADLEDAVKKGIFTVNEFKEYFKKQLDGVKNDHKKYVSQLLDDLENRITDVLPNSEQEMVAFQNWISLVKKWLMYVVVYSFSRNMDLIMNGSYKHDLFFGTNHQETLEILKGAMKEFVFDEKNILKLEVSAKKTLESLLDSFIKAVIYYDVDNEKHRFSKVDQKLVRIISENYREDYKRTKTTDEITNLYLRFLMVTDFISGMTDSYAQNLYKELNGIW